MAEALVPVVKRKTVAAGKGRAQTITKDVSDWSRNALIEWLRADAIQTTQQQIDLNNPPNFAKVDNTRGKPVQQAVRRVEITFGTVLRAAALNTLQSELRHAIAQTTTPRKGQLSNLANWELAYIKGGQNAPWPTIGHSGLIMGPGDAIVLRPTSAIPYATIVNQRVANGARSRSDKRGKGNKAFTAMGLGYLSFAAGRLRRHASFKDFNVRVVFTRAFKVAGEISQKQGTGTIVVTPKLRARWLR